MKWNATTVAGRNISEGTAQVRGGNKMKREKRQKKERKEPEKQKKEKQKGTAYKKRKEVRGRKERIPDLEKVKETKVKRK